MSEKQFRSYFELAAKQRGVTGAYMLMLLELRLDNVIYRMGVGDSRAQARQFVLHGHITVNGKKVDIPSYESRWVMSSPSRQRAPEQSASSRSRSRLESRFPSGSRLPRAVFPPSVVALPERDDMDLTIEEHLIVELYSR